MLHVVSSREKCLEGYDVATGSWLYIKTFTNQTPYAITVYNAETVRTYKGMAFSLLSIHSILSLPESINLYIYNYSYQEIV